MRRVSYAAFVVTACAGAFAAVLAVDRAESAPPPDKGTKAVREQNVDKNGLIRVHESGVAAVTIEGRPEVSLAGTPEVAVAGTPTVRIDPQTRVPVTVEMAREPFQQYVEAQSDDGQPACDEITVPKGMRLTIERFAATANGSAKPDVYVRARVFGPSGGLLTFVDVIAPVLAPHRSGWAGADGSLLFSGATAPDDFTYAYDACVDPPPGNTGSLAGVVTGWLEPA